MTDPEDKFEVNIFVGNWVFYLFLDYEWTIYRFEWDAWKNYRGEHDDRWRGRGFQLGPVIVGYGRLRG